MHKISELETIPLRNPKILIEHFQVNKKIDKNVTRNRVNNKKLIKQQQTVMVNFYTFLHHEKSKWFLN